MSRSGKHQSNGDSGAAGDDEEFVFLPRTVNPHASTSSRSALHHTAPSRRSQINVTLVGIGTVGIGESGRAPGLAPMATSRQRCQTARRGPSSPPTGLDFPALTPSEIFNQRKARKAQRRAAQEESEERLAQRCLSEKKERLAEARRVRSETESFVKAFAKDDVERERAAREIAKKARDEEMRLYNQWCASMAAAARAKDRHEAALERQKAVELSLTARKTIEHVYRRDSPQRRRMEAITNTRDEVLKDHAVWNDMRETLESTLNATLSETHRRVQEIHEAQRAALAAERDRRKKAAAEQRAAAREYRKHWSAEIKHWREGLTELVANDRAAQTAAIRAGTEHLHAAAEAEGEAGRQEWQQLNALRCKLRDEQISENRQRADTVKRATSRSVSARQALAERNAQVFKERKLDSERRLKALQRDLEEDRATRKSTHDEVLSSSCRISTPRGYPATPPRSAAPNAPPPFAPTPPSSAMAPSTGRRLTTQ